MLKIFRFVRALALVIVCAPFVLFSYHTLFGITEMETHGKEEHLTQFIQSTATKIKNELRNVTRQESLVDPMRRFDMDKTRQAYPEMASNSSQTVDTNGPWDTSTTMPTWMKQYFSWHREQRIRGLTAEGNIKYLVVSCLDSFGKCGGLSDRLKPLPLYLMMAHKTQRILLIHWTKPCPLEDFFVPPKNGVDWRVPKDLARVVTERSLLAPFNNYQEVEAFMDRKSYQDQNFVLLLLQQWDGGRILFNKRNGFADESKGGPYASMFHDMFRVMFEPSPPVALRINSTMAKLGLTPGQYTGAHVRARYPSNYGPLGFKEIGQKLKVVSSHDKEGNWPFEKYKDKVVDVATNAINCAYQLQPGNPIFFASDSHQTVQYIVEESSFANNTMSFPVAGIVSPIEPLHLDTPIHTEKTCPDFYAAFEEIWILGQSACISHGMGGYGRFASLLSFNVSCVAGHRNHNGILQRCPATGKPPVFEHIAKL